MGPVELVRWQWNDYALFHQDRTSLWLHLASVPLFWLGLLSVISWPWHRSWLAAALGLAIVPLVFAIQRAGHKREKNAAKPFTSPLNAIARLFTEQLVTFPRFVLSGRVLHALRSSERQSGGGGA